ncbi:PA domain-containing protein [Stella humosa]|uniref:PA domain-containing protein n=1 Tax=Stella humosa TaxID=94 RepID=A0A3N1L581_9PROT|nr:M28 family peptidase [Stella humosa]ROP84545.1 PA domain-containing protein [Stella humosa]BBK34065.1 peptidase M28 [Stella humosa]
MPDHTIAEQAILDQLSVANVERTTIQIGEEIPSRLAGSENGRRMAEYSRDRMLADGIEARVHAFPGLVSFPGPARLRVTAPVEMEIEANTLGHSEPIENMTGEVVYVGSGAYADYVGLDVRGRIILTELSYAPARHEKQRIAAEMGAAAAIMMNWGRPEDTAVPFGSVKPAWGNPTPETFRDEMPTIPCIATARSTGLKLKALCEAGPVTVELSAIVDNRWTPVHLTEGVIPGTRSDDFVVLAGHQDSWPGPASTDNASGNAVILELMRVFHQNRHKLRRGITAGFWTGHETGTMVGSTWYVDRNWRRLRDHAVGYILIDQPSCTGTMRWGASSNVELKRFHQAIEGRLLGNRSYSWERKKKHGDCSMFGMGIPMIFAMGQFSEQELKETALANWGWWHHTLDCTIDKVDFEFMVDHLRIYAAYLWELCTAVVLPYAYTESAQQFVKRLEDLSPAGEAIGMDEALAAARKLHAQAVAFDAFCDGWRTHYAAAPAANEAGGDEAAADAINLAMKRVNRLLIPLSSTVRGTYEHDAYGLTAQTTVLPALYEVGVLASQETPARWMLETKLRREVNRTADTLQDATELLADTMARWPR